MASFSFANRADDPFGGGLPLAVLALLLTLVGFFPSFANPAELDAWHLVHGIAATGWIGLVIVQALLIRSRLFRAHRLLGWSSLALFAVLIVTSLKLVLIMLSGASGMPFAMACLLGFSDLATMPLFVFLYAVALLQRRDRHVHSRLVSGTLLVGMLPAAGRIFAFRIPVFGGLAGALHPTYLLVLTVIAVAIIIDRRRGKLRWPYPLMFIWFAAVYAALFPISGSQWFENFARSLVAMESGPFEEKN